MRIATFILAGLQVVMLIAFAFSGGGSDPAGNAMSGGFVTLAGIVMGILLAPALILAINRRYLGMALGLASLSLALMIFGLTSV